MIRVTGYVVVTLIVGVAQAQQSAPEKTRSTRVSHHAELDEAHPAASLEACLSSLRTANTQSSQPTLATFNVRWFPDGKPGRKALKDGRKTNIEWLACLVAHTGAQAVALQEIKTLPRAQAAMQRVLERLNQHTDGSWQVEYDACPGGANLHVAIIWDAKRAKRRGAARTLAAFNPHREPCKNQLRPGLLVPLRLSDDTNIQFISVHFKSGVKRRSYDLRRQSYDVLAEVVRDIRGHLVVAGDFNTMGCSKCSPGIEAATERRTLRDIAKTTGMRLIEPNPGCSYVYRGKPSLLDGFLVERSLFRRRKPAVHSAGHCDAVDCGEGKVDKLRVVREVSDHCPLVLRL